MCMRSLTTIGCEIKSLSRSQSDNNNNNNVGGAWGKNSTTKEVTRKVKIRLRDAVLFCEVIANLFYLPAFKFQSEVKTVYSAIL